MKKPWIMCVFLRNHRSEERENQEVNNGGVLKREERWGGDN